LTTPFYMILSP